MTYLAKADGTIELLNHVPTLEEAQQLVGGYVERVCPKLTPNVVFLCDEEGHLKQKPLNAHGSQLYGGPIAGDIVVMDRKEARKWL